MSATNAPFGLKPIYHPHGFGRSAWYELAIPSGYNTSLYKYQPVKINATGQLVPVAATTDDFIGVFMGVKSVAASGLMTLGPSWTAGTTFPSGTTAWACYTRDPELVYEVQADGSVPFSGSIGNQSNITNLTANGAGLSQCTCSATLVGGTVQGQLRIIGKSLAIDNDWGDSYTKLQVQIAMHQYRANKVAF